MAITRWNGVARHDLFKFVGLSLVLLMVVVLVSPYLVGCREDCYSRPSLVATAKRAIRLFRMGIGGEQAYVDGEMARQATRAAPSSTPGTTTLETASLALSVKSFSLPESLPFPMGAGGLAAVNGRLLVLDRLGRIYRYDSGKIAETLPPVPNGVREFVASSQNMTLSVDTLRTHSIAFDPVGQRLYACYEKFLSATKNRFEIASIALDPVTLKATGTWRVDYGTEPFSSSSWGIAGGGKLLVDKGQLYFSVGDYGFYGRPGHAQEHAAQDVKRSFGKIFAMNLTNGSVRNISIGHRNTQGLVVSAQGKLFNVEQGPQGGDEINLVQPGKNYGWPIQTFGTDYGAYTWALQQNVAGMELQPPLFSFVPSIAASSIVQLQDWHARWDGDFLVGALKAQSLYRIRMIDDRVVFSEPIWIGHRVRDIVQLGPIIHLLTDDGLVMELSLDGDAIRRDARAVDASPSKALAKCLGCHHTAETNPTHLAPSLARLKDRKIGSDSFQRYSTALKSVQGTWDQERLVKFLENPAAFAPGTAMPKVDLTRGEIDEIATQLVGN
jgi:glucose/arabinose dehydrogenase/cytochrome c2